MRPPFKNISGSMPRVLPPPVSMYDLIRSDLIYAHKLVVGEMILFWPCSASLRKNASSGKVRRGPQIGAGARMHRWDRDGVAAGCGRQPGF